MPQKRKNRLPLHAPKIAATRASFNRNQTRSALLRLPVELQAQIWCYVLGDRLVHLRWIIDEDYARLLGFRNVSKSICSAKEIEQIRQVIGTSPWRHVVCPKHYSQDAAYGSHLSCTKDLKYCYTEIRCAAYRRSNEERQGDLISSTFSSGERLQVGLLRVCRMIYWGAIEKLLETTTISFHDPLTFRQWMTTQPTHYNTKLRYLRLDMDDWIDWNRVLNLKIVKLLQDLRYLRIHITHTLQAAEIKNANAGRRSRHPWRRFKNVDAVGNLVTSSLIDVQLYVHASGCFKVAGSILPVQAIECHLSRNLKRALLA